MIYLQVSKIYSLTFEFLFFSSFKPRFRTYLTYFFFFFFFLKKYIYIVFSKEQFENVIHSLLINLSDYSTDSRGDIGSWIREAAMISLKYLLIQGALSNYLTSSSSLSSMLVGEVIAGILKQSVEKIDKIRKIAGEIIQELIYHDLVSIYIPHLDDLRDIIPNPKFVFFFLWFMNSHIFMYFNDFQ